MDRKIAIIMLFLISMVASGCGSIMSRTRCYSVLPLSAEKFQSIEGEYTVVETPVPVTLARKEKGTGWEIVVKIEGQKKPERHLATLTAYVDESGKALKQIWLRGEEKQDTLFAIIPLSFDKLSKTLAVFQSHDRTHCWKLDGQPIGACPQDEIPWKRAGFLGKYSQRVMPGSPEDKKIRRWYEKALKRELTREENFALTKREYKLIKGNGRWLFKTGMSGGKAALGFGAGTLATMNPITGAVAAGTSLVMDGLGHLIRGFIPDPNHPEYMSSVQAQLSSLASATSRENSQIKIENVNIKAKLSQVEVRLQRLEKILQKQPEKEIAVIIP